MSCTYTRMLLISMDFRLETGVEEVGEGMGFKTEDLFIVDGIDFDYEFDAPQFYDFTRPESVSDVEQAELWFDFAPGYPSSHLAWDDNNHVEDPSSSFTRDADGSRIDVGKVSQEVAKGKPKSMVKFNNSSFMKPTASHLAKKNYPIRVQCDRLVRRMDRTKMNSSSPSMLVNQAIKRQKLEAGYLTNVDYQKQRAVFLHKTPKKVQRSEVNATPPRPKLTTPKAPSLETANRAHRLRSRIMDETAANAKLKNRKAFQSRIADSKRVSSVTTREEKPEPLETFTACCLTKEELNSPAAKRSLHDPVIDSLNKLCLASEANHNPKLQRLRSIGSKKANNGAPAALLASHEKTDVAAKSPRLGRRRHQCANDRRLPSIGAIVKMNRSFDIH